MPSLTTELLLVLLLIIANGAFAMSEMAVVSSRRTRLLQRANEGDKKAAAALDLADSPNRFLSTVQVGITLIGTLAGALGGATLSAPLAVAMKQLEWLAPYADSVALAIVVIGIAYLSLVIGELVPKRVALANPERIAALIAQPMRAVSVIMSPVVRLLGASTDLVLGILRIRPSDEPPITDEEIKALFAQGAQAGVFEDVERDIVESVIRLGDRRASSLMTPRPDVIWLDINDSADEIKRTIAETPYSRFLVADEDLDHSLGVVHVKDILMSLWEHDTCDLRELLQLPAYVPETMPAYSVLETFKQTGTQMALVLDEYGMVEGVLTLTDMLESIVGDIASAEEEEEPEAVKRNDGSWLVDGMMPIEEFTALLGLDDLPEEEQGLYQTLAGFVVTKLGRIPTETDEFDWTGCRFEVIDMDGPRVDKVLVEPKRSEQDEDTTD